VTAPGFSVVIAAFNAERTIRSAVRSVLGQTAHDLEVIVVDDGSTDSTAAIVRGFDDPRVRLVQQENHGQSNARNAGIAVSRGRYVGVLDSDDLWLPDYLKLAGAALDQVENPGFLYTDAYMFDGPSGRVHRRTAMGRMRPPIPPPREPDKFLLELLARNFVYVSAIIPRAVLRAVGGYNELIHGTEDYDLWLRIVMRGYEPVWLPGVHAMYRLHPGQVSHQRLRVTRSLQEVFSGLPDEFLPSDLHRELVARRLREFDHELRVLTGQARLGHAVRQLRHRAGRVRRRVGRRFAWYEHPPAEVAAAFPDLART
jgi:glycosyltransferase involved in cell wall biosynthesis